MLVKKEGCNNLAVEEDWKLAVKVEDLSPMHLLEIPCVYVNQEDGDLPKIPGMSGENFLQKIPHKNKPI